MKNRLQKFLENPNFEAGLIKWLSAINKKFTDISSLGQIIDQGLELSVLELTFVNKEKPRAPADRSQFLCPFYKVEGSH